MSLSDDPSQWADTLTLFALGADGADPFTLFIPRTVLGQIPGQGFEQIGEALTFGRPSLQELTVENLLGIRIDRTVTIDDVSLARVIDAVGGIEVDVTEELYETDEQGRRDPVFARGRQRMNGATAVVYMTYRGERESELDRFPRMQHVWEAIAGAAERRPGVLRSGFDSLGAPRLLRDDAVALAGMLQRFASRPARERAYESLPVKPVSSGGDEEVYQLEQERVERLLGRRLAPSRALPGVALVDRPRVEIRNGTGEPLVGERVGALIIPAGMNVVVTGNAPSFGFRTTRIVVYGESAGALRLGRRVRELLGAGEVEIGTRGQTVVDVTIVVGKDFGRRG